LRRWSATGTPRESRRDGLASRAASAFAGGLKHFRAAVARFAKHHANYLAPVKRRLAHLDAVNEPGDLGEIGARNERTYILSCTLPNGRQY